MEDIKNRIEAVLFTTGRFLTIDELSELVGIASKGLIKDTLSQLTEDYKNRISSLEILEENNKFKLNIKKDYLYLTTKLLNETEFDRPVQETLALIAFKQPVLQSEIIDMRGNTAYDHVKRLKELEFITSEKSGRTRLLKTTQKFYDYFDVVGTQLKEKLNEANKNVEEQEKIQEEKTSELNKLDNKEMTKEEKNAKALQEMNIERKKRALRIKKIKEEVTKGINEDFNNIKKSDDTKNNTDSIDNTSNVDDFNNDVNNVQDKKLDNKSESKLDNRSENKEVDTKNEE